MPRHLEKLYEFLKGYLMLGDAAHRDPEELRVLADVEWNQDYPKDPAAARRFADHFQQLFVDGDRLKSQPVKITTSWTRRARDCVTPPLRS